MLSCSWLSQDQSHKSKLFIPKQVSSKMSLMLMDLGGKRWSNQAIFGGIQAQNCFIMHTHYFWIRSSSSVRCQRSRVISSALISHLQRLKTHTKMPVFAKAPQLKASQRHLRLSVLLEWLLWGIKLILCYLSILRRFGATQHCSVDTVTPNAICEGWQSLLLFSKYRVSCRGWMLVILHLLGLTWGKEQDQELTAGMRKTWAKGKKLININYRCEVFS